MNLFSTRQSLTAGRLASCYLSRLALPFLNSSLISPPHLSFLCSALVCIKPHQFSLFSPIPLACPTPLVHLSLLMLFCALPSQIHFFGHPLPFLPLDFAPFLLINRMQHSFIICRSFTHHLKCCLSLSSFVGISVSPSTVSLHLQDVQFICVNTPSFYLES